MAPTNRDMTSTVWAVLPSESTHILERGVASSTTEVEKEDSALSQSTVFWVVFLFLIARSIWRSARRCNQDSGYGISIRETNLRQPLLESDVSNYFTNSELHRRPVGASGPTVSTPSDYDQYATINPWQAELGPNPVMFSHLIPVQDNSIGPPRLYAPSDSDSVPPENWESAPEDRISASPENSGSAPPKTSNRVRDRIRDVLRDNDLFENRHLLENPELYEQLCVAFDIFPASTTLSTISPEYTIPDEVSTYATRSDCTTGFAQTLGPDLSLPETNTEVETLHLCAQCPSKFRTAGQLNNHMNRLHRRRYACAHCASAFALKADLHRHTWTVHQDLSKKMAKVWTCSNAGCSVPDKEFRRKDNFVRHVARCRKEIDARKGIDVETG